MVERLSTQNGIYIVCLNNIIGRGVDGIICSTIFNSDKNPTTDNMKMVTKIIKKNIIQDIDNFIKIHDISSDFFGPHVYDIIIKEDEIYIIMELMDTGLNEWILKKHYENKCWENIKYEIANMILPIHTKMKSKKITVGDKNIDNYMFKNDVLKKIDFTMSIVKKKLNYKELKAYDYICIINPFSNKMEKIFITNFYKN